MVQQSKQHVLITVCIIQTHSHAPTVILLILSDKHQRKKKASQSHLVWPGLHSCLCNKMRIKICIDFCRVKNVLLQAAKCVSLATKSWGFLFCTYSNCCFTMFATCGFSVQKFCLKMSIKRWKAAKTVTVCFMPSVCRNFVFSTSHHPLVTMRGTSTEAKRKAPRLQEQQSARFRSATCWKVWNFNARTHR